MSTQTLIHFAQPIAPQTPLPRGPLLRLPSGHIDVQDNGRLLSFGGRWVMAIGLSESVFLVARERTERYLPVALVHELMGYLVAYGVDIIRIDFRFPLAWRHGTSFATACGLWASEFFRTSQSLFFEMPLPLSDDPRICLPLTSLAMDGAMFWQDTRAVADAVFGDPDVPSDHLRSQLNRISQTWERRWNEMIARASDRDFASDDCGWVARCESAWRTVVRRHLEPYGYQMLPASLATVL